MVFQINCVFPDTHHVAKINSDSPCCKSPALDALPALEAMAFDEIIGKL
jgi:hypothetical protein